MKKYIFIFFAIISLKGFGQKAMVQSASDYLGRYHDLPKAKEAIDNAAANESTSNDPKMWYYRMKIYSAIMMDSVLNKVNPDAASVAANSLVNCIKTDKGKYYTDELYASIGTAGGGLYNFGLMLYNNNALDQSERIFNSLLMLLPYDKDSVLKKNFINENEINKMLYSIASKQKNTDKEKLYLTKLIDAKVNESNIYMNMIRICLEEKDTAKALTYIETGKKLFPSNPGFVGEQTRIYLAQGKIGELIENFSKAIESNPSDANNYYTRGRLYASQNNIDKAEADYKKAVELKPDFVDANFELGSIYYNQAAGLVKAANEAKTNEENQKAKEKFEAKFKEAQPYFEKSKQLNEKKTDEQIDIYNRTLTSLKQIYVRTNQMDKYNEVKSELESKH